MTRIPPEVQAHFKMWREIDTETDRGAAILALAYLDDRLKDAVKSRLYNKGSTADELLSPAGFLGQYAAKCRIAYCLGLFGKRILQDLDRLGKVRNVFAHKKRLWRFSDAEIKKVCDALSEYQMGIDVVREGNPRTRYLNAVGWIGLALMGETTRDDQPKQLPPRFAD